MNKVNDLSMMMLQYCKMGQNTGMVDGILIGALVGIFVGFAVAFFFTKKRR